MQQRVFNRGNIEEELVCTIIADQFAFVEILNDSAGDERGDEHVTNVVEVRSREGELEAWEG